MLSWTTRPSRIFYIYIFEAFWQPVTNTSQPDRMSIAMASPSLQRGRPQLSGQRSHTAPCRTVRAAGLAWPGAAAKAQREAVAELLAAVEATNRGVSTTPQQRAAIEACVQRLEEGGDAATTADKLDATWCACSKVEPTQSLSGRG